MFGFKTKEREKGTKPMGHDQRCKPSPTPKLSLLALPSKLHESPGMATPPIHTMASIPFQWEEAPGKPRRCSDTTTNQPKPRSARCLELPPRMLNEPNEADMPSPTTVLDGPDYMGRSMSGSSSSGKELSSDSPENPGRKLTGDSTMLGSERLGNLKRNKDPVDASDSDVVAEVGITVKITRIRRRSSFMNFSPAGSHLLTSIYKRFKQAVVPWRRRQEKPRKKSQ